MYYLTVRTHYQKSDVYFNYDYDHISIWLDGKEIKWYGDAYHDKGREKAEGFVEGFFEAQGQDHDRVNIHYEKVNDAEDW